MIGAAIHLVGRSQVITRLLRPGEPIPSSLGTSCEALPAIDPQWIWVVDNNGIIEGCLIAAPAHGLAIMLRLCTIPSASPTVIVRLLRRFLSDILSRGYPVYVTSLDMDNPAEQQLSRIIARAGGGMFGKGLIFAGYADRRG